MDTSQVQLGPVDMAVIYFEGNKFNGDVAPALLDLAERELVTILDLAFIVKEANGDVTVIEVEDDDAGEVFAALTGGRSDLLSEEDLVGIGEDIEPNSSALIIVWENTWVARFATAVRGSGGAVASYDRIPADVVLAALAAAEEE